MNGHICLVNEKGELIEILQQDREPLDGEFKVNIEGYYVVLNEELYNDSVYSFDLEKWVGIGGKREPYTPEKTEVDLLKDKLEEHEELIFELAMKVYN